MSTFAISRASLHQRRILFVDDEPFALEVLQRIFAPMVNEWHMEFVTSGTQALERLESQHFDAIVTDMVMPGMNGAQLLEQVMQRHPTAARIILSGQADEELVFRSVNSAHQYLSKTADPRELARKIRRVLLLRHAKLPADLVELICALEHLPSIPSVYTELVEALANPDTDLSDLAGIISRDPATSAKLLQLANSAFFGLRGEVASVQEAVTFLGVETVRYLVLMVGVCEQFRSDLFERGFVETIWTHSVHTANTARIIAETEHTSLKLAEASFVAGLLHDLGKLIFAQNLADSYREVLEYARTQKQPVWDVERQILKGTHAQVGAYLLELWGLPEEITQAVSLHHQPIAPDHDQLDALAILHAANHIAIETGGSREPGAGDLDLAYLEAMHLTDRLPVWREAVDQTLNQAALT